MDIWIPFLLVALICASVAALALKRPLLFKMGMRNITRRRGQTAIVVAGLLIGTAIISSSLVVGDTLEYIFVKDALERLDTIDEFVSDKVPSKDEYVSFDQRYFSDLKGALEANGTPIDGIAPLLLRKAGALNPEENLVEGGINVIGFDPSDESGFGPFERLEGGAYEGADLGENETILNERLAAKLDAAEGHDITVALGYSARTLTVRYIVKNEGKANWNKEANAFVRLGTAQAIFNETGRINLIKISNVGDVEGGVGLTDEVVTEARASVGSFGWSLDVGREKEEAIDSARNFSENVTEIFMVLGMFSIVAGVLLIINIFVMLAEERKSEMGIARAVGMKRSHLMQTYLFEGLFYATFAAFLGTFVGVALGYFIIWSFGLIFSSVVEGVSLSYHQEPASLALAFCLGMIITFATIAVASWNISKLSIVRAIRKIPEPPRERGTGSAVAAGLIFVFAGLLLTYYGFSVGTRINAGNVSGPAFVVLGLAFVAYRFVSARLAFTLGGMGIIAAVLFPRGSAEGDPADIQMFVLIGILLVLGAVLIVMFNSDLLLNPLFRGRRKGRPVLKMATSYPMRKKFRTAMTLAIFALTIFTVTVISMMSHLQERSVVEEMRRQTGGFDIVARTQYVQPVNITGWLESSGEVSSDEVEFHSTVPVVGARVRPSGETDEEEFKDYQFWGFDDEMLDRNDYTFQSKMDSYTDGSGVHPIESDRDVWTAIKSNSSLAVIDGSASLIKYHPMAGSLDVDVGDVVEVDAGTDNRTNVTIIGIMDQTVWYTVGIFGSERLVEEEFPVGNPLLSSRSYAYFFVLKDGVDGPGTAREIERSFFSENMDAVYLPDVVKVFLDIQRSVMLLLQSYLGLGLLVGIAALAVITVRSVVERRKEIGTLRAIGFKATMISRAFLVEISFVAVLGIFIGVILGLALSYDMYLTYFVDRVSFSIPWSNIVGITIVAYIATLLTTSSPASSASKIPPAEALRYIE